MASHKQRRRKQKERRHEYEYVYLDEQGEEVAVEQAPKQSVERKAQAQKQSARGGKVPQPPSWRSVGKQALLFFAILAVAISIFSGGMQTAWYVKLLLAAGYTIAFLPFIYFMERFKYRTYMKRTGQWPQKTGAKTEASD